MNTLYRAFVGLPTSLCERDRPSQERTVFFEAPYDYATGSTARAAEVLEQLLTLAWSVDATDWCERGYVYNLRREREIFDEAMGEGDARLLEIGWGGFPSITYAKADDIDLFVSPRQVRRLRAALQATTQKAVELAHRVARLNPSSATIGAGMLASLVEDARTVVAACGGQEL